MTVQQFVRVPVLATMLVLLLCLPAQANLILNPSFEQQVGSDWEDAAHWEQQFEGQTLSPALRLSDASRATDGVWYMFMVGNSAYRSMQQAFSTQLGVEYEVTFDWGHFSLNWGGIDAFILDSEGAEVGSHSVTGTNDIFLDESFTFVATDTTSILRFKGTGAAPGQVVGLDNVRVVPEPTAATLLFAGGLMLLGRRRGRADRRVGEQA